MERNKYKPRPYSTAPETHELSPAQRAEAEVLASRFLFEYEDRKRGMYDLLKRYPDDAEMQARWTPELIEGYATGEDDTGAIERLRKESFHTATWRDVQGAMAQDAPQAFAIYTAMSEAVKDRVESGILASDALCFQMPYERLEFAIIRKGFIDEWQPRGGIESSLVDMLAQNYIAWQFWLKRAFDVATNQDLASEQVSKNKSYQEPGSWRPPSVTAKEWLDHSTQMADRFNRMFLRVLRQMRDLRRYAAPVTINNPAQVNIGGQQTNIQGKRKKKAKTEPARPAMRLAKR